ncbi:MAG: hypothetical protein WCH58_04160 [Candidatus Saccharibacteria bacterium]
MSIKNNKQKGAVSLFVVVFAALLITVVTVSFVRLMIQDQQQATTTDLSQSAYDSAQAGVEDAKRALIRYQNICDSGTDCSATSTDYKAITSSNCNDAVKVLKDVSVDSSEVKIQTGTTGNSLNQAYTCVKIILDTIDYLGTLTANESNFIPLTSVTPFDTVQIQWFSADDISSDKNYVVDLQPVGATPLLAQNSWVSNRPPILRTQFIQFSDAGFKLSDFDNIAAGPSDANTLFLYPYGVTGKVSTPIVQTNILTNRDVRKTPTGAPLPIECKGNLSAGGYSCTTKIQLPDPIGGGNRVSFLRLSTIYNKANYRVTLINSAAAPCTTSTDPSCVKFSAVQPEVDSTGRANDLFRRVSTRVELTDANFPYPQAAVDLTGNLCKDFRITDNVADYQNNCTP